MLYRGVTKWVTVGAGHRVAHTLPLNRAKRPSWVAGSFRRQLTGNNQCAKAELHPAGLLYQGAGNGPEFFSSVVPASAGTTAPGRSNAQGMTFLTLMLVSMTTR